MKVEIRHRCADFNTYRAARVKSLFNVESGADFALDADLPIDDGGWSIGVVVGPSGSGKSSIGAKLGSAYRPSCTGIIRAAAESRWQKVRPRRARIRPAWRVAEGAVAAERYLEIVGQSKVNRHCCGIGERHNRTRLPLRP